MTVRDALTLLMIVVLVACVAVRLSPKLRSRDPSTVGILITVSVGLVFSVSSVFGTVDRWLGGRSYLNLIQHLVLIVAYWWYTRNLARPLVRGARPIMLGAWVPCLATIGAVAGFVLMDVNGSSPGVIEKVASPVWLAYQVFSLMPLWIPSATMLSLLWHARERRKFRGLRWSYRLAASGYAWSVVSVVLYGMSMLSATWLDARDIAILVTELSFVGSLVVTALIQRPRL